MNNQERGYFITLEGGEGSGKSTQASRLADRLRGRGIDILQTREPGGSPGAEAIRTLLVEGETNRWNPMTELLLHMAARDDHVNKVITPALERGSWVISDRFADSSTAYQGYGHGLGLETVRGLHSMVFGALTPDLTLILDLDVEVGLRRASARGGEDRYERMDIQFHHRLRKGFLEIAGIEPDRCVIIDAQRSIDDVEETIRKAVDDRFKSMTP